MQKKRIILPMEEHQEIDLPTDIILPDGSLDLYYDVQNRFQIEYKAKNKKLIIRGNRWIGYIPINDKYALAIDTRVPVSNIERILSRCPVKKVETIQYYREYHATSVRAQSLFDVLTDQFLYSLDLIMQDGHIKRYKYEQRVLNSPIGRIDPARTSYISLSSGRPIASCSSYIRTEDTLENQIIRFTLECLQGFYFSVQDSPSASYRLNKILRYYTIFKFVSLPKMTSTSLDSIIQAIKKLPFHKDSYADALRLAHIVISGQGISIRGEDGLVVLPTILIDMSEIFEEYVRGVLSASFLDLPWNVFDGNKASPIGASVPLFVPYYMKGVSPIATPDIVINSGTKTELIIDAKYKPNKGTPDRADINQIICYAQRYGAQKAMLLYPMSCDNDVYTALVGVVGEVKVYKGSINLSALDLLAEEDHFAKSIKQLVAIQ